MAPGEQPVILHRPAGTLRITSAEPDAVEIRNASDQRVYYTLTVVRSSYVKAGLGLIKLLGGRKA